MTKGHIAGLALIVAGFVVMIVASFVDVRETLIGTGPAAYLASLALVIAGVAVLGLSELVRKHHIRHHLPNQEETS
jgi:hypothetical protein